MIQSQDLGRVYVPDPRDRAYPLRAQLPRTAYAPRNWRSRHWMMPRGVRPRSQGPYPHCVRYGCTHVLQLAPIVRMDAFDLTTELYPWAQRHDEWPGEGYAGTSVRAGLEYLRTERHVISGYHWVRSMDDVCARLTAPKEEGGGPLVAGTDWWSGMDVSGTWTPSGALRGGHCYVFDGYTAPTAKREGRIRTMNSHAGNHRGWLSLDAVEYLLFGANGEAAAVTELPK